jgi:hypothetical protein
MPSKRHAKHARSSAGHAYGNGGRAARLVEIGIMTGPSNMILQQGQRIAVSQALRPAYGMDPVAPAALCAGMPFLAGHIRFAGTIRHSVCRKRHALWIADRFRPTTDMSASHGISGPDAKAFVDERRAGGRLACRRLAGLYKGGFSGSRHPRVSGRKAASSVILRREHCVFSRPKIMLDSH